jgi:AcrR family transcriptional regulator
MISVILKEHAMPRVAQSKREQTYSRILDVAARAIRRHGYSGTGVAAVMKEAGLTHGGFYAHFRSRDALLAEAMKRAGHESRGLVAEAVDAGRGKGVSAFRALVETYLADTHLARLDIGCPIAALGCDMPRQSKAVRKASVNGVQQLIKGVQATLPSANQPAAATIAGTLVGSLQMARTLGNNPEGKALLESVRQSLLQSYDRSSRPTH